MEEYGDGISAKLAEAASMMVRQWWCGGPCAARMRSLGRGRSDV
jgi:hypothetical protein